MLFARSRELLDALADHEAALRAFLDDVPAAAVGGQQHQRWRPRVVGNVAHREHAAVAVSDHAGASKPRAASQRAATRLSSIPSEAVWNAPPSATRLPRVLRMSCRAG